MTQLTNTIHVMFGERQRDRDRGRREREGEREHDKAMCSLIQMGSCSCLICVSSGKKNRKKAPRTKNHGN